jgi:hypothetical protein
LKVELQLPNADLDRDLDLADLRGKLARLDQNVLRVRVVLGASGRRHDGRTGRDRGEDKKRLQTCFQ